ncbi:N-acetylglucosamine kinase [Thalassomonas actiniarum]|uniref:ATPase n=1 Tax=Thalassomonas actiniarum TaxID=485447 RepID=A0AAE9YQY9_9GAMM|nr:BadF/BadG/BcrA/BcrD ATPase family protein [Thalassomonas actiniarum]WDD98669.1 ATPase [Thalassomonas actiniarum]
MSAIKDDQQLYLGIDGGGSKCKAVLMSANLETLGQGLSGPANPLHGFEQATASIVDSARLALADAGMADYPLQRLITGAGLAGMNLPGLLEQMLAWQNPFRQMYLTNDLLIACLGAHNGADGAVIVTGTGSCGFSCVDGQSLMLGGHGFPQGDIASGSWFGLQLVTKVLQSLDGLTLNSCLNRQVLNTLGCKDTIALVELVVGKPATFYAQLANLVFDAAEQGDTMALAIVNEGADYLNQLARKLWQEKAPRLSLVGGLAVRLVPWLAQDVQKMLTLPVWPAEIGAVLYAQQQDARQQAASA